MTDEQQSDSKEESQVDLGSLLTSFMKSQSPNYQKVLQRNCFLEMIITLYDVENIKQSEEVTEMIETDFRTAMALAILQSIQENPVQDLFEVKAIIAILKNTEGVVKEGADVSKMISDLDQIVKELTSDDEDEDSLEVPTMPTPNPEEKSEE